MEKNEEKDIIKDIKVKSQENNPGKRNDVKEANKDLTKVEPKNSDYT